jgi:hypothetical protein
MPSAQRGPAQLNNMTQPNQNPTFTFTFDLNEANAILAGLQELPGKVCNPITEKLKAQAQEQIAAMQPVEEKANADIAAAE